VYLCLQDRRAPRHFGLFQRADTAVPLYQDNWGLSPVMVTIVLAAISLIAVVASLRKSRVSLAQPSGATFAATSCFPA
jgi:hypothetical protein